MLNMLETGLLFSSIKNSHKKDDCFNKEPQKQFYLFQAKAAGRMLFEQVCKQLNLLETDYFGLEYMDSQGVTVSLYTINIPNTCI